MAQAQLQAPREPERIWELDQAIHALERVLQPPTENANADVSASRPSQQATPKKRQAPKRKASSPTTKPPTPPKKTIEAQKTDSNDSLLLVVNTPTAIQQALETLLFFTLFFDFCITPSLEQQGNAAAAAPPIVSLQRMRIALFKNTILHTFISLYSNLAGSSPQSINPECLYTLFLQAASIHGLSYL